MQNCAVKRTTCEAPSLLATQACAANRCSFGPHNLVAELPSSASGPGFHITFRSSYGPPAWVLETANIYVEWDAGGDARVEFKGFNLGYQDLFGPHAENWKPEDVADKVRERLQALRKELDWIIDGDAAPERDA
jgi:hypothetical protein